MTSGTVNLLVGGGSENGTKEHSDSFGGFMGGMPGNKGNGRSPHGVTAIYSVPEPQPASLARDCARLKEYGYIIEECTPFDLFPRTVHVESVVKLTKKS